MHADEFRDCVILGLIFYKYLSEQMSHFADEFLIAKGRTFNQIDENQKADEQILADIKQKSVEHLGYFLNPSELSRKVTERGAQEKDNFILKALGDILPRIEGSNFGSEIEDDFQKIFANLFKCLGLGSLNLGKSESEMNGLIAKVLGHLEKITFRFTDIDEVLGDAFEYLNLPLLQLRFMSWTSVTHSKSNDIAEYRILVEGILRGINHLLDVELELTSERQQRIGSHPDYYAFMKYRPIWNLSDPDNPIEPPPRRTTKALQERIDETDQTLIAPKKVYKEECLALLELLGKAKLIQDDLGQEFSRKGLDTDSFYWFAHALQGQILDEAVIKTDGNKWAVRINRDDLGALNEKWQLLQPKLHQLEHTPKAPPPPSSPLSHLSARQKTAFLKEQALSRTLGELPDLDTKNGEWALSDDEKIKKLGWEEATLKVKRSKKRGKKPALQPALQSADKTSGIDDTGFGWRKVVDEKEGPLKFWYYLPWLTPNERTKTQR